MSVAHGYLPSRRAPPPVDRFQFKPTGDTGLRACEQLAATTELPGIKSSSCQPTNPLHHGATLVTTRSHPEMLGDMSRVTLNFDLSKVPLFFFSNGQELYSHQKLNMCIHWFSSESGYSRPRRRRRRRRRPQRRTLQCNH